MVHIGGDRMNIILKSEVLVIKEIKKKTKAKNLENLKVGDSVQLSVDASPVGRNKGTYAAYIKIEDLQTGKCNYKSFNQIGDLYRTFEFCGDNEK